MSTSGARSRIGPCDAAAWAGAALRTSAEHSTDTVRILLNAILPCVHPGQREEVGAHASERADQKSNRPTTGGAVVTDSGCISPRSVAMVAPARQFSPHSGGRAPPLPAGRLSVREWELQRLLFLRARRPGLWLPKVGGLGTAGGPYQHSFTGGRAFVIIIIFLGRAVRKVSLGNRSVRNHGVLLPLTGYRTNPIHGGRKLP